MSLTTEAWRDSPQDGQGHVKRLLALLVWAVTRWPIEWVLVVASLVFLLFIPAIFRYPRILWLHFDHWIEPED